MRNDFLNINFRIDDRNDDNAKFILTIGNKEIIHMIHRPYENEDLKDWVEASITELLRKALRELYAF